MMLCYDWLRPLAYHYHKLLGKLEQSLTQLGAILARGRREQKYSKIQENLKDLRNDTKSFNNIIKECCIEPGQRFEILHKNMEKSIAQR